MTLCHILANLTFPFIILTIFLKRIRVGMMEKAKVNSSFKCSYEDCFQFFPSLEAMRKHKVKNGIHDYYCKRCDHDADDDAWLLYHQITSPKHICCPACGKEFKSEGGRDRHVDIVRKPRLNVSAGSDVEQEHLPRQNMKCAGCELPFSSASSLMAHIEENKCTVISKKHFYHQRAERQITKDAWQTALDPRAGTTIISSVDGNQPTRVEPTLLDDDRAWIEMDWAGNPIERQESQFGISRPGSLADASSVSFDSYPPLDPRHRLMKLGIGGGENEGEHLLDFELLEITEPRMSQEGKGGLGGNTMGHASKVEGRSWSPEGGARVLSSGFSDDGQTAITAPSSATFQTAPAERTGSILLRGRQSGNDINPHITTATQILLPSHLDIDKYWDPLSEQYACPGRKCGQRFASVNSFKSHLLSDAHVNASVTCPGCMKRFRTTTALVAHCESASRKCKIRHALDYDMVIRQVTAGMISADGYQEDGSLKYTAQKIEDW